MKLLIISLLVLIFNGGVTTDTSPTTPSTGATSPGTPSTDNPPTGESRSFPIRIPYSNSTDYENIPQNWGTCFLYMEGITIVAIDHGTSKSGGQQAIFAHITGTEDKNKWIFSSTESLTCNVTKGPKVDGTDTILNGSFVEFRVSLVLSDVVATYGKDTAAAYSVSALDFTLHFAVPSLDNWYLEYVMLHNITIVKGNKLAGLTIDNFDKNATKVDAKRADIRGFYGYSYGCSATPAIFFESSTSVSVGLQFNNFQIEPYNMYINNGKGNGTVKGPAGIQFRSNVNDCVPTFTTGSLMSIISILVLFAVFIFGFLMLNSVQTMDRFDDPKGRQVVITTKE